MFYLVKLFFKKGLKEPGKITINLKNIYRNRFCGIMVVSYPKTGRTWLRVMLGKFLIDNYGLNHDLLIKTYELSRAAGLPLISFSHGGRFNLMDNSDYRRLKFNERLYRDKKVVFVIRDIRDTLVSSFFQESKRNKVYVGNIKEFLRDDYLGIKKIISFYNIWFRNKDIPKDFLLLRYEEMRNNPAAALEILVRFIGVSDIDPTKIAAAVDFASFDNMKKMESESRFKDSMLKVGQVGDGEAAKVRKGKIGGYREYLDEEDLKFIDQAISELSIDGCDWYFSK
jgi:hypothetical protein